MSEASQGEAVVLYCKPLTGLRQGYAPAGNARDVASSAFPTRRGVA